MSSASDSDELPMTADKTSKILFKYDFMSFKRLVKSIFPQRETKPLNLDANDSVAILFLTAIGIITRVFRIQFPKSVVFDEAYFGNFTNSYLRREYFHDIHPPLAKLIMAGVASYAGYKGEYNFNSHDYPSMMYVALRITPAFFGGLCVPLSYLIMRTMLCSHFASFVAAILVMSDIMLIVEARHILIDGILHFFSCLAIFSIFLFERNSSIKFFFFEGLCLGCAAACKYTSGGIVLLALFRQFALKKPINLNYSENSLLDHRFCCVRVFLLCLIIGIIHIICFTAHLTILAYLPEEEADRQIIPSSVKSGLIDRLDPDWDKRAHAPSMIWRVICLVIYMMASNLSLESNHSYSSPCWSWPLFLRKWVLFWTKDGKHIACMGNVLLWYPVFIGIIFNLFITLTQKDFNSLRAAPMIGYLLSYLPFFLIPRELFLYHYAIPLIFGIYNLTMLIEKKMKPVYRGFFFSLIFSLSLFGFFTWSPMAYGLTPSDFQFLIWNKNWVR